MVDGQSQHSAVDIRRADERFRTKLDWLDSRHSFSFGHHYDPTNVGHGLLIVSNDDRVAPGGGFATHPHHDMEIVTWVLEGELEHRDSTGQEGVLYPGLAQRMSAGSGILHSEMNASSTQPVHFVQMWVVPDSKGIAPGYEQVEVTDALGSGALVPVASGRGGVGAITINQRDASMWVARIEAGGRVELPDAAFVHCFVARGSVALDAHALAEGDAARLTGAGSRGVTASTPAEIIVWESDHEVTR